MGRGVQKAIIKAIHDIRRWRSIIYTDPGCCAPGRASLLAAARRRAIVARAHELTVLGAVTTPANGPVGCAHLRAFNGARRGTCVL
jgi:hypothetical protein